MRRHPLLRYLVTHDCTQADLARRARVSPGRLSDIIHGRRGIGPTVARRLWSATRHAVTIEDLLYW